MPQTMPSYWANPQFFLSSLCSCSTLQMRLQFRPPSPPSPILTLPHPCLMFSATYNPYVPTAPSTPLTHSPLRRLLSLCCQPVTQNQSTTMTANIP
ncbi:hypothetical protein O181_002846 [Austropuccinia psidii MF-1]|uniref:Uncharacterized protein n=1 Tax=Austropuccinia psidii MF-1 TaxID=1389203 RepID=A0A9Q3BDR6_9BASI|nr:hypothetical protein [Austropuccinia psidii MF-1]